MARPGEVVPDDPDAGKVVFDRRAQDVRRHRESAVADHGDARPVRGGELGSEHAADTEAHRRVAPAVQHALGPLRLPELHEPVVMYAGIERENDVVGQHLLQSADDEFRPQRTRRVAKVRPDKGLPFSLPALHVMSPRREARRIDVTPLWQQDEQLAHEHLRVGDHAERRRIVAAEFLRIDVDVDQLRLREIPRIAGMPTRRGPVVEARADR